MSRNVLFLLIISLRSLFSSEIVDWNFAFNAGDPNGQGEAVFTAVEALAPPSGTTAFSCGYFEGSLTLPGLGNNFSSQGSRAGLVVRKQATPDGDWGVQWATQTFSNQDVFIHDLALTEETQLIYVAGSYQAGVFFGMNQAVTLPPPTSGTVEGFVAVLDQTTGIWQSAFSLGETIPVSLDVDGLDAFYVTSETKLVAKFDQIGTLIWDLDADPNLIAPGHIATLPLDTGDAESFVLTSVANTAGAGSQIRISAISATGALLWSNDAGSQSDDQAGGLGVSPQGFVSFSLSTNNDQVSYADVLLDPQPSLTGAQETYLVRIRPDGNLMWSTRVAAGDDSNALMNSTDLAHDPLGNVHLAVNFSGPFTFEGRQRLGNQDAAILSVGDGGIPYHMLESTGDSATQSRGIAAPLREEQIIVGNYEGAGNLIFGNDTLPGNAPSQLFAAFSRRIDNQAAFIIRQADDDSTPPDVFLQNLRAVLNGEEGVTPQISIPAEIFQELNAPNLVTGPTGLSIGIVGFAAFISAQDIDVLQSVPAFQIEEDPLIRPSGTVSPSSYNLARLNDSTATPPYSYTFPELCQPVRLYLIDTAVSDPGGSYFASNSNLTILDPIPGGHGELIRAPMETAGIVTSEHGSNLLSLIAGPGQGVAQATPITTKVYDIFPSVESARASALVEALLRARLDRTDPANIFTSAVIVIASNSVNTVLAGDLPALEIAIDACCAAEIPIVMSAGNDGANASSYAPAMFGNRACVLCTGATSATGSFLSLSNRGPEVQIVAPGQNTIVATEVSGAQTTTTFTGTSASAALAAGALIHFHSANPWLFGSDLITEFLAHSTQATTVSDGSNIYQQVRASPTHPGCHSGYTDWTSWFALTNTAYTDNDDGDFYTNLEEYVHGLDPNNAESLPHLFGIESFTNPTLTMGFPVAWWLWDPAVTADADENYLLRDGETKLRIASSTNLVSFDGESITLTPGPACGVQTYLTFDQDVTVAAKKFFRIESTEP